MIALEQMLEFRTESIAIPSMDSRIGNTYVQQYGIQNFVPTYEMAIGNPGGLPGQGYIIPDNSRKINQVIVPSGGVPGIGGDIHDNFQIDRYNNLYNNHTTIRIPGGNSVHMPWDEKR